MSITVNDAGTLRTLSSVTVNDGGTLRSLNTVWANDSGTLREIFSAVKPPSSMTITQQIGAYQSAPTVTTYTANLSGDTISFTDTMYAGLDTTPSNYSQFSLTSSFTLEKSMIVTVSCTTKCSALTGYLHIKIDSSQPYSGSVKRGNTTHSGSGTYAAGSHTVTITGTDSGGTTHKQLKITALSFTFTKS